VLSVVTLTWLVLVQAVGFGDAEALVPAEMVVKVTVVEVELASTGCRRDVDVNDAGARRVGRDRAARADRTAVAVLEGSML